MSTSDVLSDGRGVTGWFDSHCHLQERYLPEDVETSRDALLRCRAAGIDALVCVGTDATTSAQALDLARAAREGTLGADVPSIWATIGLHPHEATSGLEEISGLLAMARSESDSPLVAIGECGLDFHYDHSPRPIQRDVFAAQIGLANAHDLALVIHARDAWDDLFDILAREGTPRRTVLHCFTGGPEEARACLDLGMFVSFSGIVTFKNAEPVREAAARCPLDQLLIETDSPFLAPVPHRGQDNEPSYVPFVGAAVAGALGVDVGEIARVTAQNAARVFGIPEHEAA